MGLQFQLKCQPAPHKVVHSEDQWHGGGATGDYSWRTHGIIGIKQ